MDRNSSTEQSTHPVVGKLFALITCRLEDTHGASVDGHQVSDAAVAEDVLGKIETASEEITTLCEAIRILADTDSN